MPATRQVGKKTFRLYNRKNFRSIGQLGSMPREVYEVSTSRRLFFRFASTITFWMS